MFLYKEVERGNLWLPVLGRVLTEAYPTPTPGSPSKTAASVARRIRNATRDSRDDDSHEALACRCKENRHTWKKKRQLE